MGVKYFCNRNNQRDKNVNSTIKKNFFFLINSWIYKENKFNTNLKTHLLGKRSGFAIINTEHQIEMLKRTISFLKEVSKPSIDNTHILFLNTNSHTKFDAVSKLFALRCGEIFFNNKWIGGTLTKTTQKFLYKAIIVYNPEKNIFFIKEINKIGIPLIAFSNVTSNISTIMYPVIGNNSHIDSIFYSSLILSNSILETKLLSYLQLTNSKR